ncbi:MAG: hypothetical protein M5R36_19165 [Deltaproteobacteria bacterium]|nr:hypothetical protein [Deltaproteobacteria bacterium]
MARQFFLKEIRGFFRDTSQWTQLLLLLALIVVYLFNFKALDLDRFAGITWNLRNTLAYVNLGLAGFVLSAICVRFVLPAVSLEGKAFWIVRSAPVSIKQFMWTKFRFYALPVVVVSEMLILMSNFYLGSSFFMTAVCAWVMGMLSVGITGLAVGIGAMYPNFEEKNVARMASGVSSIIYMSISAGLIVAVVGTMAYPVKLLQRMMRTGSPLVGAQWAIVGLSIVIVLSMIAASVLYPMRKGIESLDQREL